LANQGITNIRLFDNAECEVPFAVRTVSTTDTLRRILAVELDRTSFAELPGNRIRVEFRRDSTDSVPTSLGIVTPMGNFDKTVDVFGSDDGKRWRTLAHAQPIFDYQRYTDARSTEVAFEHYRCRWYRVEISNVTTVRKSPYAILVRGRSGDTRSEYEEFVKGNETFRVDGIGFYREQREVRPCSPVQSRVRLQVHSMRVDSVRKTTVVVLRSRREPLRRLAVWTAAPNYARAVVVESCADTAGPGQWSGAGLEQIGALSIGALRRVDRAIELPRLTRASWYRLTIENEDNRPLAIDSVVGEGDVLDMVFFPAGARELTVCYGCFDTTAPSYEVGGLIDGLAGMESATWLAGPEVSVAVRKRMSLISGKTALIAAMLAMVAALVWAVVSAGRRVSRNR